MIGHSVPSDHDRNELRDTVCSVWCKDGIGGLDLNFVVQKETAIMVRRGGLHKRQLGGSAIGLHHFVGSADNEDDAERNPYGTGILCVQHRAAPRGRWVG